MKTTLFALALALSFGAAIPAMADSGGGEGITSNSPNSLPPGFYNGTPQQAQIQSWQSWYASQPQRQPNTLAAQTAPATTHG